MINTITTDKAPKPIGPYVQAKLVNGILFTSGQLPINLDGSYFGGTIEEKTEKVMTYIHEIMKEAGAKELIKINCILADLDDFGKFNTAYEEYLNKHFPGIDPPARETIEATIVKGLLLEISAVAE